MIRVVLDTSVLVSAVISPTGPNAQVLDLIVARKIKVCLTDEVLAEYYRVFAYERLQHLDRRRIARLRGLLEAVSLRTKSRGRLKLSGHEDDNRFYECAAAAKADYIVTENTRHFKRPYKMTKIITARNLLRLLQA
jgi:putative PIN family toxin of toxin-antitoxin system